MRIWVTSRVLWSPPEVLFLAFSCKECLPVLNLVNFCVPRNVLILPSFLKSFTESIFSVDDLLSALWTCHPLPSVSVDFDKNLTINFKVSWYVMSLFSRFQDSLFDFCDRWESLSYLIFFSQIPDNSKSWQLHPQTVYPKSVVVNLCMYTTAGYLLSLLLNLFLFVFCIPRIKLTTSHLPGRCLSRWAKPPAAYYLWKL